MYGEKHIPMIACGVINPSFNNHDLLMPETQQTF